MCTPFEVCRKSEVPKCTSQPKIPEIVGGKSNGTESSGKKNIHIVLCTHVQYMYK